MEVDLKQENKKLLQQVSVLEQQLQQYQTSGAVGFYYELNRWQNEINQYMKEQKVSVLVGTDDKDKKFDRVLKLIEQGKENVTTLETLKPIIGITGDEQKDKDENWIAGKDFISNVAAKRS